MHHSMMLLWVFAFALVVYGAPRPGLEDKTSSSTDVYSWTTRSGTASYPYSVPHSTISSISSVPHGHGSSTLSELSSHHHSILASATSVVTHVHGSATHSVSLSHHPSISHSSTTHLTKSTSHHSSLPSPTCHPKINSYLIKVEHDSLCDDLKEYPYLIYTPPHDHSSKPSYPIGSIGQTIYKPDTFVALFFIFSGDLTCGNATLAQYPKAYPHHHAPSSTQAEFLFILIGESCPVGIAHELPPASVGYKKFGTDEYGHLTFAGVQKWAVCWSSSEGDSKQTRYVYWLGEGEECPENCVMDAKLKLVPYGFPSDHDYYHHGHPKSTYTDSTYPYETCSTGYEVSSHTYVPTYTVPTIPTSTKDTGGEYTTCDTTTSKYSHDGGKGTYTSPYTSTESCSEREIYPTSTYTSSETCTESTPDTKPTKHASSESCSESETYPTSTYTGSETCTERIPYATPTKLATYTSSETPCTDSDTHPTYTPYSTSEICIESESYHRHTTSKYTTSETCTEGDTHPTSTYPSSDTCSNSETYPTSTVYWGSYPSSYPSEYEDCDDDDYSYYSSYPNHHHPTSMESECTSSTTHSSKVYLTSTPKTSHNYVKSVSKKHTSTVRTTTFTTVYPMYTTWMPNGEWSTVYTTTTVTY